MKSSCSRHICLQRDQKKNAFCGPFIVWPGSDPLELVCPSADDISSVVSARCPIDDELSVRRALSAYDDVTIASNLPVMALGLGFIDPLTFCQSLVLLLRFVRCLLLRRLFICSCFFFRFAACVRRSTYCFQSSCHDFVWAHRSLFWPLDHFCFCARAMPTATTAIFLCCFFVFAARSRPTNDTGNPTSPSRNQASRRCAIAQTRTASERLPSW